MEPKPANVAKAAAMLFGEGAGDVAPSGSSEVTERVERATPEEVEAESLLSLRSERAVKVIDPNKTVSRDRDVMGRFNADGTPKAKPKTKAAELAASLKKAEPAKESPPDAEAPAEKTRAEKAREQLTKLRADRAAKAKASAAKNEAEQYGSRLASERARIDAERTQTAAERARWEAARRNPIAGFAELGLDPSQAFLELAEAAKKANTPEARIEAVEALLAQRDREFAEFKAQTAREKEEAAHGIERARAEAEFLTIATKAAYPYAHTYLAAEAKKQGLDPKVLWMRAADGIADEQRASGKTPSYKSIADEIEEYAHEVVLEMLAGLPPESGGTTAETTPARKASEASTVPAESKGKSTIIGNDLASTRLTNNSRRLSLAERQKKAERLI